MYYWTIADESVDTELRWDVAAATVSACAEFNVTLPDIVWFAPENAWAADYAERWGARDWEHFSAAEPPRAFVDRRDSRPQLFVNSDRELADHASAVRSVVAEMRDPVHRL